MGQSESEEVSTKLEHETPPLPSTSCQPCLPTPLSAQVQWNTNNRPTDVDEKFFLGGDTPSLTGNQALDGGIVGLGLVALGAAVLGPTIQGALNGGQQSQGYSCGRRKRQANFGGQTSGGEGGQDIDGEERFFLPTGQGCTCNGRRRRQAPGENEPGTRFFGGLFGGQQPHCGSCCYNT